MRAVTHCLALQIILLLCCESSPQGSCDNPDCGSNTPFWEREANLTRARAWYPRDEPALGSEHVVDVNQACVQAGIAVSESGIPLHAALAWAKPLPDRVVVFVMRAGENEGVLLPSSQSVAHMVGSKCFLVQVFVQYEIGCHSTVAAGAAAVLGATPDDVKRPLRLFSVGGRPGILSITFNIPNATSTTSQFQPQPQPQSQPSPNPNSKPTSNRISNSTSNSISNANANPNPFGGRPLRAHDNANMELFDGILHVYLENEEWVWAGSEP